MEFSWQFYSLIALYGIITFLSYIYKWQIGVLLTLLFLLSLVFLSYHSKIIAKGINTIASKLVDQINLSREVTYTQSPLAVLIYDEENRYMWGNLEMVKLISQADPVGLTLEEINPDINRLILSEKTEDWSVHPINMIYYRVYHDREHKTLYLLNVNDETQIKQDFKLHHMVLGYLLLDDYDEVVHSMEDSDLAKFDADLIRDLNDWANRHDIFMKRIEEDKFLLIFNLIQLENLEENHFKDLISVRQSYYEKNLPISISVGIAYSSQRKYELTKLTKEAQLNLDLALGRGGDQIVVKAGDEPARFYGGDSNPTERRTNTRAKLVYQALVNQISQASNVLISGHKVPDLDSIASSLGVLKIVNEHKKMGKIIADESSFNQDIQYLLDSPQIAYNVKNIFLAPDKVSDYVTKKTLIILVDHHRPSLSEAENLIVQGQNIVIIDHHRRSEEFPVKTVLTYIEPSASSTAELVTEFFMNQRNTKESINRFEATALMAGIVVDTNNFSARTGSRTFDAASYLKSRGADMERIQWLLKEDLSIIKKRNRLIERTHIYREMFAISFSDNDEIMDNVTAAQAADALLGLSHVQASFVVFRRSPQQVGISARSLGSVNVQKIMEKMGGGGHLSNAATQLNDVTIDQAISQLKEVINEIDRRDQE